MKTIKVILCDNPFNVLIDVLHDWYALSDMSDMSIQRVVYSIQLKSFSNGQYSVIWIRNIVMIYVISYLSRYIVLNLI